MTTFRIGVTRTATRHLTIPVEADTQEEANFKALEEAPDHNFNDGVEDSSVDYDLA